MRLILQQQPVVPKYVRNVTSPAPHLILVPGSVAPQIRAALTDVLLTPVPPPVALEFVPHVIQHRNRSQSPVRVLLLLRQILVPVDILVLPDVPNTPANVHLNVSVVIRLKRNAVKCIQTIMIASMVLVVVKYATIDLSVCRLPAITIITKKPAVYHGN